MDPRSGTTIAVEFYCKSADVFDISVSRRKCVEGEGKNEFKVFVFVNFVKQLFQKFFNPHFLKFVPEICLLPLIEIVGVLKQLNFKISFIPN